MRYQIDRCVCILGLGYVGLTVAVAMADVGFDVIGVEIQQAVLDMLARSQAPFHEPGLTTMLRRVIANGRLRCVKQIPRDCEATVYMITVGTPLGPNGRARLDMVEQCTREVAEHVKDGDMVVLRSTVKLGTTRRLVRPLLEATGKQIDLAFCPERTIEGRALTELRELPQIVGADSEATVLRASQMFHILTPTVVRVSDIETAETIKLVDNVQRDVSFAFANEIAMTCDAVGVSAAEVIRAGKLGYPRTNLPMPGPVGGPCLSKDPYIFLEGLRELGKEPKITSAARQTNEMQPEYVARSLRELTAAWLGFPDRPRIALLGLAFKGRPVTDDLRGTMAKPIYQALRGHFPDAEYIGFDAAVSAPEIEAFGMKPASSLEEALLDASLAIIMNNHPVFEAMPLAELSARMARPGLIYDFWNHFKAADLHLPERVGYMALGSHGKAVLPESQGQAGL